MASPALATLADLEARGVDTSDAPRAQAYLEDASALMRAEVDPVTWIDDDTGELDADRPEVLVGICCKMVQRATENPNGISSESVGEWQASYANASPDLYLTRAERRLLRRAAGLGGVLGSVGYESPHPLIENTSGYADVSGQDEPIIFGNWT